MFSTIDLFAGAGGLSSGFQQTGEFDIKAAYESNPAMQETYKKNHPDVEVYGDVRSADYKRLQEKYGPIDVVIGGPPCQGFSNANRQRNHAVNHNNSMVKEYIRAVVELKPKAFVMENVSMLRSDVHRFYLCRQDLPLVESGIIDTEETKFFLLDRKYVFDGVLEIISHREVIENYIWPESDFHELNVIYKATRNNKKLRSALEKHRNYLCKAASRHLHDNTEDRILCADTTAFQAVQNYYSGEFEPELLQDALAPAIMYQKMLNNALEIYENDLIVDKYSLEDDLYAVIRSYAVFDYFKAVLGQSGSNNYVINTKVLSAADFGAPQKRKRFVAVGIRRDITDEVKMPDPVFDSDGYRTVADAIEDLEDVSPVYSTKDDVGIKLEEKESLSELAKSLRDSEVLYNHIITKSTDIALQRFRELKQGENFHSLSDELKTNTFSDVSRTQNTIYLRLKYNEPSETVTNVRKSMWVHPVKDRAISVREAARLQTFPDSFVFTGTKDKQYQQVGNAVPPVLAKAIAETLAKQLETAAEEEKQENG